MKLIWNWKQVIKKGWSVRFIALTGILTGCEMALPMFSDMIPRNLFLALALLTSIGALWARIVMQRNVHTWPDA